MAGDEDRRAAAREAARQRSLEALRTRPRRPDAPALKAWFPADPVDLGGGVAALAALARNLTGITPFADRWQQFRTEAEFDANRGLDPLADPLAYEAHLRGMDQTDDSFVIDMTGFGRGIPREAENLYTAYLVLRAGLLAPAWSLDFTPRVYDGDPRHPMPLDIWKDVVAEIVAWRQPVFLGIGGPNYAQRDAVFDHRVWPGWVGWFPARIAPGDLPGYALAVPVGEGTLVATQALNIDTTDPQDVARAQEVEVALNDLGVLPTRDAVIGHGL